MADPRHLLGRRAEDAVGRWLASRGWLVLAVRWRSETGELDLVCRDPDRTLVAVEVKVRRGGRAGTGAEGLTSRQLGRLRRSLARFAAEARLPDAGGRIDLVEVSPDGGGCWRARRTPRIDAW